MTDRRPTRLPSLAEPEEGEVTSAKTSLNTFTEPVVMAGNERAFVVAVSGFGEPGKAFFVDQDGLVFGRSSSCTVPFDDQGVSRRHARIMPLDGGEFQLEDLGSSNGTYLNGRRIDGTYRLLHDDRIRLGATTFRFDDGRGASANAPASAAISRRAATWTVDSWTGKPAAQQPRYDDPNELERVVSKLRRLPPLVTSWEIEKLKKQIAEAQEGERFVLQGGDCAETFEDCESGSITNKLKILLQMSLVLMHAARKPIVRIGRFAGQYAKPRSKPTEIKGGVELPSYVGDLVNRPEFTPEARRHDPQLLLAGYNHASLTLNFVRALCDGGFSTLRRPEYFDLAMFERANLPSELREDYARMASRVAEGLSFLRTFGEGAMDDMAKVEFFASHEGLNLTYESAQTRRVPRRDGHYCLTTHMPWIGERTRDLQGAHVEFFRGILNPVGVKIGPKADPAEVVELVEALNPSDEPGKIVLIVRMGAGNVTAKLPPILEAVRRARRRVLWVSDPMHGNGFVTRTGIKTRNFDDIMKELEESFDVHEACGTTFGGVHFELTGDDVTECIGAGIAEGDLDTRYLTTCDPRLNYRQAVQMAFFIAQRIGTSSVRRQSTIPPPG